MNRSRVLLFFLWLWLSSHSQTITTVNFSGPYSLNETSVAIHPNDPSEIVMSCNVDRFFFSQDSGKSWDIVFPYSDFGIYGDPVLHYADGQLFYAHLSKTEGKKWGDWFDRIVVDKITDLVPYTPESFSVGYNEGKMQDKPWMSSDEINEDTKGRLYLSWTEFDKYNSKDPKDRSRIRFSYYDPKKNEFNEAITISDTTGDCRDGDNTLEGAVTAVGKDGELYAAWAGYNKIYFDRSSDGGLHWGMDKVIAEQVGGWDMEIPHIMRTNGMPFMSYDAENDILYICWSDRRNGTADVWLKYSKNRGDTWSEAISMSSNTDGSHQFSPNMCFDNSSGMVQISYMDQEKSTTGQFFHISHVEYKAGMTEELITRSNVSGLPFSLAGERFFFGDYLDLDVHEDLHVFSYTAYRESNTSAAVTIIPNMEDFPQQQSLGLPNVLMDSDTIFLNINASYPIQLKYKMKVKQGSKTKKVKGKLHINSSDYTEYILGAVAVDPNSPISVECKYKLKDMIYHKTSKRKYSFSNL